MKLEEELSLRVSIKVPENEAVLSIYLTGDLMRKRAREFFGKYGITDVQFNLMELLSSQADEKGLTQAELSKMLLVNRSNITSLIDRMEKVKLVKRCDVPGDRRYNAIQLTPKGRKALEDVEETYMQEVRKVMNVLTEPEMKKLVSTLEKIRRNLRGA